MSIWGRRSNHIIKSELGIKVVVLINTPGQQELWGNSGAVMEEENKWSPYSATRKGTSEILLVETLHHFQFWMTSISSGRRNARYLIASWAPSVWAVSLWAMTSSPPAYSRLTPTWHSSHCTHSVVQRKMDWLYCINISGVISTVLCLLISDGCLVVASLCCWLVCWDQVPWRVHPHSLRPRDRDQQALYLCRSKSCSYKSLWQPAFPEIPYRDCGVPKLSIYCINKCMLICEAALGYLNFYFPSTPDINSELWKKSPRSL